MKNLYFDENLNKDIAAIPQSAIENEKAFYADLEAGKETKNTECTGCAKRRQTIVGGFNTMVDLVKKLNPLK